MENHPGQNRKWNFIDFCCSPSDILRYLCPVSSSHRNLNKMSMVQVRSFVNTHHIDGAIH